MLNGFLQIVNSCAVLDSIHNLVDAAEVFLNSLTTGQKVGPALRELGSFILSGPNVTLNVPSLEGIGVVGIIGLSGVKCICECLYLRLGVELFNHGAGTGYKGNSDIAGVGGNVLNREDSGVGCICLCGNHYGGPTLELVFVIACNVAQCFNVAGEYGSCVIGNVLGYVLRAVYLPRDGKFILEHVIDDGIHVVQRFVILAVTSARETVRRLLKAFVAVVLVLDVILHLLCSILVVLDFFILLEHIHQEAKIAT